MKASKGKKSASKTQVKRAVHQHESNMHAGEKKTKLKLSK